MSVIDRAPETRRTTWTEVDPGFYVANRGGEFIGYVDRAQGAYVAFDGTSALLGRFPSLTRAQVAVLGSDAAPARPRRSTLRTAALAISMVSAAAAVLAGAAVMQIIAL
jgi:hypothetical protein